jgi:hypothetical protein
VSVEGARQCGISQHLGDQGQVEHLEAGAAVGLGHAQARDAHLDQALPQGGVVATAGVEDLAQPRRRALRLGEAAHGLLQQLLLLGQSEMHQRDPRASERVTLEGSPGRTNW